MKVVRLVVIVLVVVLLVGMLAAPVLAAPLRQDPVALQLTPELLASALGVLISLAVSYIPGFRERWAALSKEKMQLYMAGAMVVVGAGIYLLACSPGTGFTFVACPAGGGWALFSTILSALIANQVAYRVSPQVNDVKQAKTLR